MITGRIYSNWMSPYKPLFIIWCRLGRDLRHTVCVELGWEKVKLHDSDSYIGDKTRRRRQNHS